MAVTLAHIAQRLKVSTATVSLGLRGNRRISETMRTKIARAAEELGYKPNPLVSALMVSLHGKRRACSTLNLCFLTAFPTRDGWKRVSAFRRYHEGARHRAADLGYGIEVHWMGDAGGSGERMSNILETRGIPGVLIAPLPVHGLRLGLDWDRFSTVALGWSFNEVPTHHVANSLFHTINTALATCRDRGFTRIGFVIPKIVDDKTDHIWLSAYLGFLARHRKLRKLAPLLTDDETGDAAKDRYLVWHRKHRPEVVVTTHVPILGWLRGDGLRVPEDVAFIYLDYTPERGDHAGVNQQPEKVGAAGVDLLVEQINQNRRGIPDIPKSVLIEGMWREGPTCPPAAPAVG